MGRHSWDISAPFLFIWSYCSRRHCVIGLVKMDSNWPSCWPWLPRGRALPGPRVRPGSPDALEETTIIVTATCCDRQAGLACVTASRYPYFPIPQIRRWKLREEK